MSSVGWTFVTGATGFIGHYVLSELLRRGVRCLALVRGGDPARLRRLLAEAAPELRPDGSALDVVAGELPDGLPPLEAVPVERVVHVAASTRFRRFADEPERTNVEGVRRLLAWMEARGVADLTHVSTAYVCGAGRGVVGERVEARPPSFHNDYERSKWQAERLVTAWAAGGSRRAAIARPSIVAGEFRSGRASEFRGFYALARAVEQLARSVADQPAGRRHRIQLRLRGEAHAANQLVPVDYVARAIAALALDRTLSGVFHLAHPRPPTNGQIKRWLEEYFDLGGGEFVGDRVIPPAERSAAEDAFYWGTQPLATYFADTPVFDCSRARAALEERGIGCPEVDFAYVARCIAHAQARRWGRGGASPGEAGDTRRFAAAYFERFLPAHVPQSVVSRMTGLRATVRFVVDGGHWVCRFEEGLLREVQPGHNGVVENFGYRTNGAGFWRAVSGDVDGQELFAAGEADVFGDVEGALKMSAVLREFTRQFPCDRARLEAYTEDACTRA